MEITLNILLSAAKLFDIKLINEADFFRLLFRFAFNSFFILGIVRYIYYPTTKRKDYLFTYIMFSVIVFFLCQLLANVKLGMGFALGLFAIFGIIRYRTDAIPIKEMTYLFVTIGLSAMNALANKKVSHAELLFTNVMIFAFVFALEKIWLIQHESSKNITYEKIELIKPEHHEELMEDLRTRTGLNIHKIQVGKIDFLKDVAMIRVFFHESEEQSTVYQNEKYLTK